MTQETLRIRMRDGTHLATDIYLPDTPSTDLTWPFPTLVCRTPYNKNRFSDKGKFFARHGYAVVVQDVRGRYASDGAFYPYRSEGHGEAKDSYVTIEWAASQRWSSGEVGTFGYSYMAGAQWAIVHNDSLPPHLETMIPAYASAGYYGQGAFAGGAALLAHNIDWLNGLAIEQTIRSDSTLDRNQFSLVQAQEAIQQLYWRLPVHPFKPHIEWGIPWLNEGWHAHETYDDYWTAQVHTRHYEKIDIPVLNIGGWYDVMSQGTVWNYQGL